MQRSIPDSYDMVAIFRESGLRDDVTIANLQDAHLELVVLARARARELQVDKQVELAQRPLSAKTAIPTTKPKPKSAPAPDKPVCRFLLKPDGCQHGDNCQYAHLRANGKCLRCGSESHNLQACTRPRRQQSSRSDSVKPQRRLIPNPRAKPPTTKDFTKDLRRKRSQKASRRAREARLRVETLISMTTPRLIKTTKKKYRLVANLKKMIQKLM